MAAKVLRPIPTAIDPGLSLNEKLTIAPNNKVIFKLMNLVTLRLRILENFYWLDYFEFRGLFIVENNNTMTKT